MKILITGSTGFLGRNLLPKLKDHEVLKVSREGDRHWRWAAPILTFRPDVIFSLAGEIYNEHNMYDSNVDLVHDLLYATKTTNYKAFIHIGSSSEYGRKSSPIKETDCPVPTTLYEGTKAAATMLCTSFGKTFKKPVVVARPFSLYGPQENPKKLIPTLIRAALTDKKIKLSKAVHDYVYVDDFIDGLLRLVTRGIGDGFACGEIINFGSGVQHSNYEIAQMIENIMGITFSVEWVDSLKNYDSLNWVCDPTYAKTELDWQATTTLEDGLRKVIHEFTKEKNT